MSHWEEVVGQLGAIPDLPGARCRGRWELFDQTLPGLRGYSVEDMEYARSAALRLCDQCPALPQMRWLVNELPHTERPLGVVAGRINRKVDTHA